MALVSLRAAVVEACRRLDARGLIGGGEGNISVRLGPGELLVTPSGMNKAYVTAGDLVIVSEAGDPRGRGRASSEIAMHVAAYGVRPEIGAVVHAHPLAAVAHTLAGRPLLALTPEAAVALGEEVAVAPFAIPGTRALAESIAPVLRAGHSVILLERHGAIAVGRTVREATDRMEILERVAVGSLLTTLMGGATPLPPDAIAAVLAAARAAGLSS